MSDFLSRLAALIPEATPQQVEKIVELLRKEIPSWEIADCLGLGTENSSLVLAVKQSGMFLMTHRFLPVELPALPHTKQVNTLIDSLSPDEQLSLLSELYDRRAELLKVKVSELLI